MIYDVIIVGGGPSGMSAAIYASRARLKTLLIEKAGCGGQIAITDHLENYPGFEEGINGFDLAMKMEKQARTFGCEISYGEVSCIEMEDAIKKVILSDKKEYFTKTIIIASGANFKKLGVEGEETFIGKGVSYCATCDGPFFRNKEIAVVGGGDSALQEALYLTKFATKELELWGVNELSDSSVVYRLVVEVEPTKQFETQRFLRKEIKKFLDKENIKIPYHQIEVHHGK